MQLYASVNMDALKKKMAELQQETLKEDFWQNKELFTRTNQEISSLKRRIVPFDDLKGELQEAAELFDMALQEQDSSVLDEICGNDCVVQEEIRRARNARASLRRG